MDNDTKLRCLDLFSGIGGISLGLKSVAKTVCYCEIDPYAVGVLIKNMAKGNLDVAPIWSDVTTLGQSELDQIGPIDIISGGFPCQDISCQGHGVGIEVGDRSGLFFEIVRLIRLVRPSFVFLENVSAITFRGMDTVLRELAQAGYDAEWAMLGASDIGADHQRKRWWLLAHAQSLGWDEDREVYHCRSQEPKHGIRFLTQHSHPIRSEIQPIPETDFLREADVLPADVDRFRCLGNSVVPQCIEYLFSNP